MNIALNILPIEIWRQIAFYDHTDNKLIRLNKYAYSLFSEELKKMKIIFECFSNLQSYFSYESSEFSPVPFNPLTRVFICLIDENQIEITPFDLGIEKIVNFHIVIRASLGEKKSTLLRENTELVNSYSYFFVESNQIYDFKHPIQKIEFIKSSALSGEVHYFFEKAKIYANKFYEKSS